MKTVDLNPDSVVVHYHEIALKGGNRPFFLGRLADNILTAAAGLGIEKVVTPRGRILLYLEAGASWSEIRSRLKRVFGIANFSPAWRCETSLKALEDKIAALIKERDFESFRIAARRGDKRYPLTSMDLNQKLGRFVQDRTPARVDLERPQLSVFVEVLSKEALIYLEKFRGPGGLPVGMGGRVCSLLSGGIDSPVASYRMMKRGCTVTFIHFHSYPYLSKASWEKAEDLVEHLTQYQYNSRLYLVPFGEIQRRIVLTVPPPLRVVLYRRFMLRIAEELAIKEGAKALVTGESLGQVASQTLDNIATIQEATHLPVLRPLIGQDKEDIIADSRAIETYPISIQPDQDCCRLFVPPHPSVRARLEEVRKAEGQMDTYGWVKMGLEAVEVRNYQFNNFLSLTER
jgi:tRNA uracil 4-sulfurtransferase